MSRRSRFQRNATLNIYGSYVFYYYTNYNNIMLNVHTIPFVFLVVRYVHLHT